LITKNTDWRIAITFYFYNYNINLYSAALQCCPGALNSIFILLTYFIIFYVSTVLWAYAWNKDGLDWIVNKFFVVDFYQSNKNYYSVHISNHVPQSGQYSAYDFFEVLWVVLYCSLSSFLNSHILMPS